MISKTLVPLWRRVVAGASLFLVCGIAMALPADVDQGPNVEGVTQYTLKNGLKVLLFPDPSQAKVTVNITYLVGSRNENYGETGMAHLLEHLVFKGTPTRPNIFAALGERGMSFNGTTWYDRTNYFETFPASDVNLDWALGMEADRMVNSFIAKKDLDSEMTVVRNEMEKGENDPQRIIWQRTVAAAYNWHNYGKSTIGARSDVENVDIGRLQAFYRMYYQPDNAVLVVAGAFDSDKVLALVDKYFAPIPRPGRVLPRLYTEEPVQDGEREVKLRRVGNTQWLAVLYHTVPGAHADSVALEAVSDVLTIAPSGRLYKALVEQKKASSVDDWIFRAHDAGVAMFFVQVPDNDSLVEARAVTLATVESLNTAPITAEELERVKVKALKGYEDTLNDPQRLGISLSESIAQGDWRLFFLRRDDWRKVTVADAERAALAYLKPSNRTIGEFIPEAKPDRAPVPPKVDVAALVKDYKGDAAIAAGEAFDATPGNLDSRAERFALPNGMKVALLPKKTRGETVNFVLRLHYGDEKSVFGKNTEGSLTAAMLMRGTTRHSRQEIEDTLDRLHAKMSVGGGPTGVSARGQTVRASVKPTLELLAEVLREPAFPASELDTLKRAQLAGIEQQRTDPQAIAMRTLNRYDNPYPPGDPRYTPTVEEQIRDLQAPTAEALGAFYKRFYGASTAEVALVGDFDPAQAKAELQRLFGGWSSAVPYQRVPDPLVTRKPTTLPTETPDKANAFLVGEINLPLNDRSEDYAALVVANQVLGGSSGSRLIQRVRQKEGLSYGVGSSFRASSFEANSPLVLYAIFAPQNLPSLRNAVKQELDRAVGDGFTDEEVAAARQALLQARKLARTQDGTLAEALAEQSYLGRTFDFSARVDAAIAAVTTADANAALRKYLKPDSLVFAFAGDFAKNNVR